MYHTPSLHFKEYPGNHKHRIILTQNPAPAKLSTLMSPLPHQHRRSCIEKEFTNLPRNQFYTDHFPHSSAHMHHLWAASNITDVTSLSRTAFLNL
jgi:hypothetical protein